MPSLASQVSSGQHFEDTLKKQLAEKRSQVLELEKELGAQIGGTATLKGKLVASEEVRILGVGSHDLV